MTMPDAHDVKIYGGNGGSTPPAVVQAEAALRDAEEVYQTLVLRKPDPASLAKAEQMLAAAQGYVIDGDDMLEAAGNELADVRTLAKTLEDDRLAKTRPLDKAKAGIMELYAPAKQFLQRADAILTKAIGDYRRKVQEERQRLEAEAAERARKERERLEAQAAKLAEKGKVEKAETLRALASAVPQTVVLPEAASMSKLGTSSTWKAEVTNKHEFVKFVAANPQWLHLLDENMPALNGLARSQKEHLNIPGVTAKEVEGLRRKGR